MAPLRVDIVTPMREVYGGPADEVVIPVVQPAVTEKIIAEAHALGIGTIFLHNGEPRIHFHGAYGKHDTTKVGCLRELAETFLVMEAIIMELQGVTATRELDPLTNMVLLKIPGENPP